MIEQLESEQIQVNPAVNPLSVQVGGEHYKHMKIQPVEFCHVNSIGTIESNIIKYVCRHKFKNGAEDVKKAIHNCELLLKLEYNEDTNKC